jgi:G6PDH family F420-dependent oxidoreductase
MATRLAGRIGDGYCGVDSDAELVALFRSSGGGAKPAHAGMKACWSEDEEKARRTAHSLWATEVLPGELGQELPTPAHYEEASSLVTEEMVAEAFPCGPDAAKHLNAIHRYIDAGYDEIYIQQMGPEQQGFFRFYAQEVLPGLH